MSTISLTKVKVTLQGLPPGLLMQGKGVMEADAEKPSAKKGVYRPASEEAELRAHWKGSGKKRELCIPSVMFYNSFCQAAMDFQNPLKKKQTMGSMIGSTIAFDETMIGLGHSEFEVYEDYVRIPPRTGQMVKIGRPLIRDWKVTFGMTCDNELWTIELLPQIITSAGKVVGIGAWRPKLKGCYGKFTLVEFKIV